MRQGGAFMALIRPCADLRNNYNEISKICHETKEPMYITKNGTNDLVILSDEAYEELTKGLEETEEKRIDRLVSEHFDKQYATFEEFQKDIIRKIEESFKDIEEGHYVSMEEAMEELEEKYGFSRE